jgi:putative FmdB family regulatory protein
MPTYEYRCPDGHDFERFFRKISDAPGEVACPVCGKIAERRVSAGAGLLFKGSGFYLTDYGKNAHRGAAPTAGGEAKAESSGGEAKSAESSTKADTKPSDAKPAAAPASTPKPKSDT